MKKLRIFFTQEKEYLSQNQIAKPFVVASLFLFPAAFLFISDGNIDYLKGGVAVIEGTSLYETGISEFMQLSEDRVGYVYLPNFAILHSILLFPFYILSEYLPFGRNVRWLIGTFSMSFWIYFSYLLLPYISSKLYGVRIDKKRVVFLLLLFPSAIWGVVDSSSSIMVAMLAVAGVYAVRQNNWILAGILIGFSTFKFNGIPFAIVLFGYALWSSGIHSSIKVAFGGLVSQIPSFIWWVLHPEDLFLVLRERGGLSVHSHEISGQIFLFPIKILDLTDEYIEWAFLVVVFSFSIIGVVLAVKSNQGLILGFPIGYISTSLLVPGEMRLMTLGVFGILLLVPHLDKISSISSIFLIYITSAYQLFAAHPNIVGLNTLGIPIIYYSQQFSYVIPLILVIFIYDYGILYRIYVYLNIS